MTRRIHLLLLVYGFEAAGAEKVVLSLAKAIDRTRFRVAVCGFRNGRLLPAFRDLGIPVYLLDRYRSSDPRKAWGISKILREERIDILHSHNFSPNFWGRAAGLCSGTPVLIITEHTVSGNKKPWQRCLNRILSRRTDAIVAVSENVRHSIVELEKIGPSSIRTIHNGIPPSEIRRDAIGQIREELLREHRFGEGDLIVSTVGRLEEPKGHRNLLRSVPIVRQSVPRARFLVVGDGSLRAELEREAKALGVDDVVVFAGFREEVRRILAASDLCVIPSSREGFSITLLEAMSVGTPVVATDVGGNGEAIIDGRSGILVPPEDPVRLAGAVIQMLGDGRLRKSAGENGRMTFLEHFLEERMVSEYENLYRACAEGAGRAS